MLGEVDDLLSGKGTTHGTYAWEERGVGSVLHDEGYENDGWHDSMDQETGLSLRVWNLKLDC